MDVEGVYRDLQSKELVRELAPSNVSSLRLEKVHDATGGIHLKLRAALRMASNGTEVDFVSGFKPKEFAKALKALSFRGTRVKVSQT
jgi:isopentenyl phosphate kinase